MISLTHTPAPPLSRFVDFFWFQEGPPPAHARERVLPSGTMELIIGLQHEMLRVYRTDDGGGERALRGTAVCGAHAEFFVIDTAAQASIMGVHFLPGGAARILGLPATELSGAHVGLDDLWGAAAAELRELLLAAPTPAAKFRALEQRLMPRARRAVARHGAVDVALRAFEQVPLLQTVAQVTDRVGLSPRRFIPVFAEHVGLTPKRFCRVRRFQEVLRLIDRQPPVDWVEVALACGYFDQSHFIRDFRAFSGLSPTAYQERRGEHVNHVPLPGD